VADSRAARIRVLEGALEEVIRKTRTAKDPITRHVYSIAVTARHGKGVLGGEEVQPIRERRAS